MILREVRNHLENVIIPFWMKLRDDENGGYYGYMNFDLEIDKKAVKGCILNSRILWFFSNAYTTIGDKRLLSEAYHAYEFMKENCIDYENGGIFWSLTYDGQPMEDLKHTYNQAFAIYALASYYEATKDKEALELAYSLYHVIENKCRDEGGYLEAFDRKFEPIPNEKLSENGIVAERTMNTLLHVFEAYTELYRVTRDRNVAMKMRWIMNLWADKIYNKEIRRQEVFFDHQYNSILNLHSYGHDIETAWLMDRGLEILGDEELTRKLAPITRELTKKIYERAFVDGSLLNECENGIDNTSRIWWVQAETVVGFLNGYEKEPTRREYLDAVKQEWQFIKNHMVDKRSGSEWFWEVDKEGLPTSKNPIVEPWKCPYHNGRMCFEVINRLG
jgi:mannobiose 2-epimerase